VFAPALSSGPEVELAIQPTGMGRFDAEYVPMSDTLYITNPPVYPVWTGLGQFYSRRTLD